MISHAFHDAEGTRNIQCDLVKTLIRSMLRSWRQVLKASASDEDVALETEISKLGDRLWYDRKNAGLREALHAAVDDRSKECAVRDTLHSTIAAFRSWAEVEAASSEKTFNTLQLVKDMVVAQLSADSVANGFATGQIVAQREQLAVLAQQKLFREGAAGVAGAADDLEAAHKDLKREYLQVLANLEGLTCYYDRNELMLCIENMSIRHGRVHLTEPGKQRVDLIERTVHFVKAKLGTNPTEHAVRKHGGNVFEQREVDQAVRGRFGIGSQSSRARSRPNLEPAVGAMVAELEERRQAGSSLLFGDGASALARHASASVQEVIERGLLKIRKQPRDTVLQPRAAPERANCEVTNSESLKKLRDEILPSHHRYAQRDDLSVGGSSNSDGSTSTSDLILSDDDDESSKELGDDGELCSGHALISLTPFCRAGALTPFCHAGALTPFCHAGALTPFCRAGALTPFCNAVALTPFYHAGALT